MSRSIDADYLKTWFGEKDLYTYDYIIGTIDDAPTVKPEKNFLPKSRLIKKTWKHLWQRKLRKSKKRFLVTGFHAVRDCQTNREVIYAPAQTGHLTRMLPLLNSTLEQRRGN